MRLYQSPKLAIRLSHFLSHDQIRTTSHFVDEIYDDFSRHFRPNSATCFVKHGSNSPISFMTHWKVMFCLDPICSLCPINSRPYSSICQSKLQNFKYIGSFKSPDGECSKDANVYAHRYGKTKNVRINQPVKGSVHPSCTGNETG